ncbi:MULTISPECIES: D-alanyl-D-alanine carboxypeptidase family protein [Aerococcus]|uniref:M15 family metallopeptidase n=2 Tax=Aerococcus TaxID=1375 RepID=A0A5N1GHU6_9LACT|nr:MULTISPECIES: M15 family metallopeptidase [Aerococcus]KAA9300493.1 M15 family metallopeptidase [Aerococcus sanguinicola]MDK6369692.1 M15 family metallopeptidase [Aerococcus sp. UMB9870]MDK6680332.1 M15 family metallopeptidase [Aerococcus sp. UMB8608]MDK6686911.1 M15 family metallopeptidase [Aerococcus sp. UMB8623]MDK6940023.1 M15 family metallopeptidase [Aerococcus sp. UMB8487]
MTEEGYKHARQMVYMILLTGLVVGLGLVDQSKVFEGQGAEVTNQVPALKADERPSQGQLLAPESKDFQAKFGDNLDQVLADLPDAVDPRDWRLILVNRQELLDQEPDFQAAQTPEGQVYDQRVQADLEALMADAQAAGHDLRTISAFRSIASQAQNRQHQYEAYLNQGKSKEEAERLTDAYIAPERATEHATGLAFDWLSQAWLDQGGGLDESFRETPAAQWLADNAHKYGFILRYLEGSEAITGYEFEPWHYRYVGRDHAAFIHRYQLTLEEYLQLAHYRDQVKQES